MCGRARILEQLETPEHMDNPDLLEEVKQITTLMAQKLIEDEEAEAAAADEEGLSGAEAGYPSPRGRNHTVL